MKKIGKKHLLFFVIIIVVFIAVFLILKAGDGEDIIDVYSCEIDSDCIEVKGDCCGCNAGGTATAINKQYENYWNIITPSECLCPTVISNHPSCYATPKCIEDKCVLVSDE